MKTALLIIDVQNDYFAGGKCELFQPDKALANIQKLLTRFRENRQPVYFIQHISELPADEINKHPDCAFLPGTNGVQIHSGIAPLPNEDVIVKHMPSSFLKTTLLEKLKAADVTDLVICGMMTHMCVDTTTRAASGLGYPVKLIENACTTKHADFNGQTIPGDVVHRVHMASLKEGFADVLTCEEYLQTY